MTTVRKPAPNLATTKHWRKLAVKLHRKAVRQYTAGKSWQVRRSLARTFHEIKHLELYKDLGYKSWQEYTASWTGAHVWRIDAWARIHKLFENIPDLMQIAPPGFFGLRRLSLIANMVTTQEEMHWWMNLVRVTTWGEYKEIVKSMRQAQRCGHPTQQTHLIVGWVDHVTYTGVVSRALTAARKELGKDTSLGDAIAWACANATGSRLPRSVGGVSRAVGTGRTAQPAGQVVLVGGRVKEPIA